MLVAGAALAVAVMGGWLAASPALAGLLPQPGSLIVTMTSPPNGSTVSGTVTVSSGVSALKLLVSGVRFKLDGVRRELAHLAGTPSLTVNAVAVRR